ncbi:MAG: HAMP domain-containing protein [Myxococcales bacterium]|nr:HAMP domain-containing protein [Myxococcales bacterium]
MRPGLTVRQSIPGRVFTGFVILLMTFGAVTLYTVWQVRALGADVTRLYGTVVPLPAILAQLRSDLQALDLVLAIESPDRAALRRDAHVLRRRTSYLDAIGGHFERARARIHSPDAPPTVRALTAPFAALERRYADLQTAVEGYLARADDPDAATATRREARRLLNELGRELELFDPALQEALDRAVLALSDEERRAAWGAIVLAAAALVIGLLITQSAARLLRPLRSLRDGVERIARGDYAGEPVPIEGSGELAALAHDFNRMADAIRRRDAQLSAQQRELLHRERLATVGRMSAQITHELRNPLSSIGLNSELLMEELEAHAPEALAGARDLLADIIKEVERLREITEEYLRFARLPRPERIPVDLNHTATELAEFVRTEMERARVKVRVDPDPAGRPALVDPNQLRSALINLLRNAREAMPQGGHVVMRVRSLGDCATLTVVDDGPGVPRDVRHRLFEPFFSTKPQGTGLGLAMVKKIIEAQDGAVTIDDATGGGTAVRLDLPLAPYAGTQPPRPAEAPS